ncbi:type I secretion system permease/ATPase [Terrihabitans rhizophilus]|uniref:Type I secretion system permease/ATPase n=1 Tax=Terrihabitans rhizophilus TaxID=3092662 RepID=A0ABU4RPY7_9HYPH|nr:type I secretion system permease/ATPase [Terrihabitans sp. PJ23]MDX6806914.1 type I secretion system permease/ATPase [Terrihabitans sp. PJ23]
MTQARDGIQKATENAPLFDSDSCIEALRIVTERFGLNVSEQSARQAALWRNSGSLQDGFREVARHFGLKVRFVDPGSATLTGWNAPFIVIMRDGTAGTVTSVGAVDAGVIFAGDQGLPRPVKFEKLLAAAQLVAIPRPAQSVPDARVDTYIRPVEEHWFRRIILRDLRPYAHVMVASLIANVLGLAGVIFSMQVYDRVVPAQSYSTLYVLASGVLLAILFDFMLRRLRMGIIDVVGKRADREISDRVFGHALRVRNASRPPSTGTFIAQLRDLDQVRELLTSTTVSAFADLPFFLLFLVIFFYIGGVLVLVPVVALLLILVPGLLLQRRLKAYASEAMREASLRNAILVEAVQGGEDIKGLQAEERFQQQWNHLNAVTAEAQLKQRGVTNSLNVWSGNVQTAAYAATVLIGAPMVIAGDLTTGALVGASILGSRMMAPMGQLSTVLTRWQQAKVARNGLDQLMKLPVDHPEAESRIHIARVQGHFHLKGAQFRYGDETSPLALTVRDLRIQPGEKIAVLGRNGAGKSTLLQAMAGLLQTGAGEVLVDHLAMNQVDPSDLRRDIGLLTQNSRLFHGTLRENILMGAPRASQDEILSTLAMVGADEFVRKLPKGLDHLVSEGGHGLSGGQRQAVLLARLLIRQPSVVLLDEPTAAMDEATERHFISNFMTWSQDRTVLIATHRMRVLELVSRLIVVDGGRISLDEGKDAALKKLRGLADVSQGRRS